MASIAMTVSPCPPRESLKRGRMVSSPIDGPFPILNEEGARMIKRRCFQQEMTSEDDLPKYSQRQFEYLEQVKQAELNRLRYAALFDVRIVMTVPLAVEPNANRLSFVKTRTSKTCTLNTIDCAKCLWHKQRNLKKCMAKTKSCAVQSPSRTNKRKKLHKKILC
ncbi:hypothetical protein AC1031_008622 [Aphanomyces cochlioides]|nr:hypothetical protein AC1031_008622 [Aphanomyces cochlioides]